MEDLATRQLQQLLNAKNQFPEIVLLKTTTTSTNDDMREIAQKGISTGLYAAHSRLRAVVSTNDNGSLLKGTFI